MLERRSFLGALAGASLGVLSEGTFTEFARAQHRAQAGANLADRHGSFGREIIEEYVSTYRDPARVHGVCEEYRAAATIDVEHDRADKEASKRIECPMLHLWAEGGPLDIFYAKEGGPLGIWRQWAPRAQGQAMKGGHFFPEENPDDTGVLVKQFLSI